MSTPTQAQISNQRVMVYMPPEMAKQLKRAAKRNMRTCSGEAVVRIRESLKNEAPANDSGA